jgi:hypothetical protein
VGANSVLVFVNDQAGSQGLGGLGHRTSGAPDVQDVTVPQLAGLYDGSWSLTRDVSLDGTWPAVNTTVFLREPLSGTYNNFEFQVPRTITPLFSSPHSQEDTPAGAWNLQFKQAPSFGGGMRNRVIGTGEMTGNLAVGGVANSIGYAFWGFGNFASASSRTRYLTVNGAEPLQNASNYGFFPFGWNFVTHKGLRQGDYPIWGQYFAIIANPSDPFFVWMNQVADFVVGNYPEYADWTTLRVFKSHYNPDDVWGLPGPPIFPGMTAHNGIAGPNPEWGGTVAGQTYGRKTESDYFVNSGGQELTNRIK